MATVNTNDLRIKNAKNLIGSFNRGPIANSYVFVGRVQPWADDNLPTPPQNNNREFYRTYDDMFALSRIGTNDSYHMINKIKWVSGVTYDIYQHNYTSVNRSFTGASNLYDSRFFVLNSQNSVYVCLDNNNNTTSTVEPLADGDDVFYTSDGYQWLRLYNILDDILKTRSTDNLMPVAVTRGNTKTDGAIYTTLIDNGGSLFTVNPAGANNQISAYYAHIEGDGTGAVAKVSITNSVVSKIEMARNGSGYTFGTLEFTSGNVYQSLSDLDLGVNGLNPEGDGNLRTTSVISPPGGWGSDIVRQLGGTRVGVFSSLNYPLFVDYYPCPFRQVGILQDFDYQGANPSSLNACYAVRLIGIETGESFIIGESIEQEVTVNGVPKIAKGTVISWNASFGVLRYVQNSDDVDSDGQLYRFSGDNNVIGKTSTLVGIPYSFDGEMTGMTFDDGYANSNLTKYTGYMTYLSNISPIARDPQQSERVSLVIAF